MTSSDKYFLVRPSAIGTNFLSDGTVPVDIANLYLLPRKRIGNKYNKGEIIFISRFKNQKLYPIFDTANSVRLWSPDIIKIITTMGDNWGDIEFFPAQIMKKEGGLLSDEYLIMNVMNVRNIIDFDKSIIHWNINEKYGFKYISRIKRFVPRYEKGGNLSILEIEQWRGALFFHEKLINEIIKHHYKGIDVFDPENEETIGLLP